MADRLAHEPSPYLQQHVGNPVDWWPWGDEAFAEARRRDAPVFLSIGYTTCHWCHVMAHESFEDEQVARLLNRDFVAIKVDREERPDVDAAYMAVCQAMTGAGGWPLTVVLTPDRRPWFAGTYFPRDSHPRRIGMLDLLPRLAEAWRTRRDEVEHSASHIVHAIAAAPPPPDGDPPRPDAAWIEDAVAQLKLRYDEAHGGFGTAPKFPSPHQLRLLLRAWRRRDDGDALHMVERTLDAMARGGIHDHLGGGFHRYSTDPGWLLPHFEKMLYDQATLLLAYTEAWQATRDDRWRAVAEGIAQYILRDLRLEGGAFASSEDADSEGEEGRFYVWTKQEIQESVGKDADRFCAAYGVTRAGNHVDEATRRTTGRNVLHLPVPAERAAHEAGLPQTDWEARMAGARARLLAARGHRVRPLRDDKVLADWNGLAVAALAKAGAAFGRQEWVDAAATAAAFVLDAMRYEGRLRHAWRGRIGAHGFLGDHAFLAWGLLELFTATQDVHWLRTARETVDGMLQHHLDPVGGLRMRAGDGEMLPIEPGESHDGALPSGGSVAVHALWRLARVTGEPSYETAAWDAVQALAAPVASHPAAFCELLCALDAMLHGGQEVVVNGEGPGARAMLAEVRTHFHPDTVLLHQAGGGGLQVEAPWSAAYPPGAVAAYVCRDHACGAPVHDAAALRASLGTKAAKVPPRTVPPS